MQLVGQNKKTNNGKDEMAMFSQIWSEGGKSVWSRILKISECLKNSKKMPEENGGPIKTQFFDSFVLWLGKKPGQGTGSKGLGLRLELVLSCFFCAL